MTVRRFNEKNKPLKNKKVRETIGHFPAFGCFLPVRQGGGKMAIFCKFILDGQRQIGLFMCMGGEGCRSCRAITARK